MLSARSRYLQYSASALPSTVPPAACTSQASVRSLALLVLESRMLLGLRGAERSLYQRLNIQSRLDVRIRC
jgi:hypothetical protein